MADAFYDVLIVGNGLVGASLACALGSQSLRVGVIDAQPLSVADQPSYDERSIALAYGTSRIFQAIGLWHLLAERVTPIRSIHISDRGHFGVTRLAALDEGVPALGYVAAARLLSQALVQRLGDFPNVELQCPATVECVLMQEDAAQVTVLAQGERRVLGCALLVAADGTRSSVREQLNIPVTEWRYGQTAVIANLTPRHHHRYVAYERFTDSGPLALLPLDDERCALVWTLRDAQVEEVMALDDAAFLHRLQARFGYRLGIFQRVGARHAYPLALVRAHESVRPRLALIGNAAHTLHPVAGQGFNLGLRDAAALADVVCEAVMQGADPGAPTALRRYAQWRRDDQRRVIAFTDTLARLFASPLAPLAWARSLGLLAVDVLPPLKHALTHRTMGLSGRLSRLARGVPLS